MFKMLYAIAYVLAAVWSAAILYYIVAIVSFTPVYIMWRLIYEGYRHFERFRKR